MYRILIYLMLLSNIFGDVMYEMETTSQGLIEMGQSTTTLIRNFIKGDFMRTEIQIKDPILGDIERITIIRLDKGVAWVIDNEHKEYAEFSLKNDSVEGQTTETPENLPEIKVEKLEETKKILGVECDKYIVSLIFKLDNDTIEMTQTMWLGKDFAGYDEIMSFNKKMLSNINSTSLPGVDNKLIREFQKHISEIDGFPLELQLNLNTQNKETDISMQTKSTIKKISTVPISNRVFEIPEGYQLNNSIETH